MKPRKSLRKTSSQKSRPRKSLRKTSSQKSRPRKSLRKTSETRQSRKSVNKSQKFIGMYRASPGVLKRSERTRNLLPEHAVVQLTDAQREQFNKIGAIPIGELSKEQLAQIKNTNLSSATKYIDYNPFN